MEKIKFIECNDGRVLRVGDTIVSREAGVFEGLFGKIIDITNAGKVGYDVHCTFVLPILKREQKKLEERFFATYDDDEAVQGRIPLNDVPMRPDDLYLVQRCEITTIYVLRRIVDFSDGAHTFVDQCYSVLDRARYDMRNILEDDRNDFISAWRQEEGFYEGELRENSYSAGVNNQDVCRRYSISIVPQSLYQG